MNEKRRRRERQSIHLAQLKADSRSLLSWGGDDPVLRKLATYRLYQAGYAAADIAEAFGMARSHLYTWWSKWEAEGVEGLVDKRWGSPPRQRTEEREAEVLRAKARHPERSDGDWAEEFGMDRSTLYRLLKEQGLQDLHRILEGGTTEASATTPGTGNEAVGEKRGSKWSPANRRCS